MQAGAGVELHAKPGDRVTAGEPLLTLHTDDAERFARARAALEDAVEVAPGEDAAYAPTPLVLERVAAD